MDDQTAKEREQAIFEAQEIETRLFRLTTMSRMYSEAEVRHNREQSPDSWKHREEIGKMYMEENQWFYDRALSPQWSESAKRFIRATPMMQEP